LTAMMGIGMGAWATAPGSPDAPASSTDVGGLEEIVVTAEKRSEDAQRAPVQITAISGDLLTKQTVSNIQGMAAFAPNLELSPESSNTQIFIRGIGQNSDAASDDPGSAIYIDQVYTPRQATTGSMFDVERLEVLPGPQGTLYGRNAAGGALNIITKVPTDDFGGEVMLEGGNYSEEHAFAALNLPVSDTLALRGAFDFNKHDGYLTSGQDDLNSQASRLTALYKPFDGFSVLLRGEYDYNRSNGDGVVDLPLQKPSDPWYNPIAPGSDYFSQRAISKVNAEVNYTVGDYTLTYIPAYVHFLIHDNQPLGELGNYFPNPNDPGTLTGFYGNLLRPDDHQQQITNELRLAKETGGYHWVVGLYQLASNTYTAGADFQLPGGPGPYFVQSSDGPYRVQSTSYAAFGEGTYSFTDQTRMTLGGRLSDDLKSGVGAPFAINPGCQPVCATPFTADDRWTNFDWKVGVQRDLNTASMLYATVQTGYLEGGFDTVPITLSNNTYEPEKLIAYSAGSKNRFLDNRLQINDEVFYYDYRDLQVNAVNLANGINLFFNAPKSRIYGNELNIKFLLPEGTEIGLNLGLLSAKFVKAVLPPATVYACGPGIPASVPCQVNGTGPVSPALINYAGTDLSNSPPVSGTAYIDHNLAFRTGATLDGRISTHYEDASWALYSHLQGLRKETYSKTDATLTFTFPGGKYYVALWGKNLFDAANFVTHATSNVYGLDPAYIEPPRTYGGRFGVKF
jgi:iron complex outermembrane receptor protein